MADPWGESWQRAQQRLGLVLNTPAGWTSMVDPGEPETGRGRWSVTPDEGAWLREQVRGKAVVEIGTGLGISTRYMAETAHLVFTCDIDPWVWREVWPDLAGLDNVIFMRNPAPLAAHIQFDIAFVDGRHTGEAVATDISTARFLFGGWGGMIILHDMKADSVRAGIAAAGLAADIHNDEWHNGFGIVKVGAA